MKCVNCKAEIPNNSRFCLSCGAPQTAASFGATPIVTPGKMGAAADGGSEGASGFSWAERQTPVGPTTDLDLEARQRYNIGGRSFGCLAIVFFAFMGVLLIIPAVPLLAFFGLPAALILAPLIYTNTAHLRDKIGAIGFLRKVPGFQTGTPGAMALAVFLYLVAGSSVSILLLVAQSHAH